MSERLTVEIPAEVLLAIRDALIKEDVDEAYNHLYFAVPWQDPLEPWKEWEALATGPAAQGPAERPQPKHLVRRGLQPDGKYPPADDDERPHVARGEEWQPIETALKDGTHILAAKFDGGIGFGYCGKPPTKQPVATVVHWFDGASPGFYVSVYGGDEQLPAKYTHWQRIPSYETPAKRSHVPRGPDRRKDIYDPFWCLSNEPYEDRRTGTDRRAGAKGDKP